MNITTRLLSLPWTVLALAVQRMLGDVTANDYARRMIDAGAQS